MRVCCGKCDVHTQIQKLWNVLEKTQAWFQREKCVNNLWFHRESAWKTCDFGVINKFFTKHDSSIVNLFSSQWFIANTVTDPGDHERARVSPESARKGTQGQNWSQWFWWVRGRKVTYEWHMFLSFFILLVSPWYMYKGSCFRDVCADTVVVGGYFRGSIYWGVYIYIYISLSLNTYPFYIIFQGSSEKGYFQWIMYFLERANLTGHFGSSGIYIYMIIGLLSWL